MLERRQDIGGKTVGAVLAALVGVIMTITWFTAKEACNTGQTNSVSIAVLQEQFKNMDKRLTSIEGYTKEIARDVSTIAKDINLVLKRGE